MTLILDVLFIITFVICYFISGILFGFVMFLVLTIGFIQYMIDEHINQPHLL